MKRIIGLFIVIIVGLLPIWPYIQQWGWEYCSWAALLGAIIGGLRFLQAI